MRQKMYIFTMRTLMSIFAKELYTLAPGQKPFRATDVMNEARNVFLSIAKEDEYSGPVVILESNSINYIYKYMKELFMQQPGFILLNFTRVLLRTKFTDTQLDTLPLKEICDVMATVPNDGIRVLDRYSTASYTKEAFDNDFIDLDAFLGNFASALYRSTLEDDCFLCDNKKGNPEKCKTCYLNEDLTINYFHLDTPRKGKVVCLVGCPYGLKICCSDCDKEDCDFKCDDVPTSCSQWLYDKNGTMNPEINKEN